jgi:hypothetical protein
MRKISVILTAFALLGAGCARQDPPKPALIPVESTAQSRESYIATESARLYKAFRVPRESLIDSGRPPKIGRDKLAEAVWEALRSAAQDFSSVEIVDASPAVRVNNGYFQVANIRAKNGFGAKVTAYKGFLIYNDYVVTEITEARMADYVADAERIARDDAEDKRLALETATSSANAKFK